MCNLKFTVASFELWCTFHRGLKLNEIESTMNQLTFKLRLYRTRARPNFDIYRLWFRTDGDNALSNKNCSETFTVVYSVLMFPVLS